ncbi:MAG: N-acetyl-gamma-glutamyl-phosphate reductase [Euryarchaeota archaeon]|nr:N-acetyl-gamma-glutamyl-phosphate reductase [Euryarchaeota archaeon]
MAKKSVKVGVAGATGYAGAELLRLLLGHPAVEVASVTSRTFAGKRVEKALPHLNGAAGLTFRPHSVGAYEAVDVFFSALPHGVSAAFSAQVAKTGAKVIDLSADLRLDEKTHAAWYGGTHPAPDLLAKAVYGLPELNRTSIKDASVVANPGCYPTGAILAILPLLEFGLASKTGIIVDSKSGVSGAGREPSLETHFPEMNESVRAYKVGNHRHTPEIEGAIAQVAPGAQVTFTPHIVPMNRGITTTAYLRPEGKVDQAMLTAHYEKKYSEEPFVRLTEAPPDSKVVRLSNFCDVSVKWVERTGTIVAMSAIDNLMKGAAGQAVQNMNIMLGLDETIGLPKTGVYP